MFKFTILILSLFSTFLIVAQEIGYNEINSNNIKTGMHSNGCLFFNEDFNSGNFLAPYTDDENSPTTLFGAGIWMGGKDELGYLRTAYVTYNAFYNQGSYIPGPTDESILGNSANNVWKVTAQEIETHINDYQDGIIDNVIHNNILSWPAKGNSYYDPPLPNEEDLAPFIDKNADGIYDPYQGDHPVIWRENNAIVPDEMLFTIYNSNKNIFINTMLIDVHVLMYSFKCNNEAINNTIFTQHKFIQKEDEILNSFKFGFWQDNDLGCYKDDLLGCDTSLNAFYSYNHNERDGGEVNNCSSEVITYDDNPPVHSSLFLNQNLDNFLVYMYRPPLFPEDYGFNPTYSSDYYNTMNSEFRDGVHMSYGNDGYTPFSLDSVKHIYPDDPNDPNGWSMLTHGILNEDSRAVASTSLDTFNIGQIFTLDMAHIFTQNPLTNNVETVTEAKIDIQTIQTIYDDAFDYECLNIVNSITLTEIDEFTVYPNPSNGRSLKFESEKFDSYTITDQFGKIITKGDITNRITEIYMNVVSGTYILQLLNNDTLKRSSKVITIL